MDIHQNWYIHSLECFTSIFIYTGEFLPFINKLWSNNKFITLWSVYFSNNSIFLHEFIETKTFPSVPSSLDINNYIYRAVYPFMKWEIDNFLVCRVILPPVYHNQSLKFIKWAYT